MEIPRATGSVAASTARQDPVIGRSSLRNCLRPWDGAIQRICTVDCWETISGTKIHLRSRSPCLRPVSKSGVGSPQSTDSELVERLSVDQGDRFEVISVESGQVDKRETSADAYDLWFEIDYDGPTLVGSAHFSHPKPKLVPTVDPRHST